MNSTEDVSLENNFVRIQFEPWVQSDLFLNNCPCLYVYYVVCTVYFGNHSLFFLEFGKNYGMKMPRHVCIFAKSTNGRDSVSKLVVMLLFMETETFLIFKCHQLEYNKTGFKRPILRNSTLVGGWFIALFHLSN